VGFQQGLGKVLDAMDQCVVFGLQPVSSKAKGRPELHKEKTGSGPFSVAIPVLLVWAEEACFRSFTAFDAGLNTYQKNK
jgi:hypothetical protein